MAQVLVRDLDPSLVEKLKKRARRNGRSLEAELRLILQHAVGRLAPPYLAEVQRIRKLFEGRSFTDSRELIREDRDR